MKLIEFGSSRVKVYDHGVLTGYHSLNLIAKEANLKEIEKELKDVIREVGVPDKSFFTEWVRGHKGILDFLSSCDFLGEIVILSGEDEARAFVKAVEKQYSEPSIICDIGGGSVQIQTIEKQLFSFRSGSIFLEKEVVKHPIPLQLEDIHKVRMFLETIYSSLQGLQQARSLIVGSTQVRSFFESFWGSSMAKGYITREELREGIDFLTGKSYEEIRHIYPKQEGYMYGVQLLLINAEVIGELFGVEHIIPTNASWIEYYLGD